MTEKLNLFHIAIICLFAGVVLIAPIIAAIVHH